MDTNAAAPTLLVLAAGMGSRYGGLKQLDPVGPGGATILDYSIYDARRAGFGEVVFVIRPDMKERFAAFAAERYGDRLTVGTAIQAADGLPAGRTKPWGTAHAVLSASTAVTGPFVVVNADDFYGAKAFEAMAQFLRNEAGDSTWAVTVYRLSSTVGIGGVNRAVCRVEDGWLREIEEVTGISATSGDRFEGTRTGERVQLGAATPVSMNMWGFTPDVFGQLAGGFNDFLMRKDQATAEYLIPDMVQLALDEGTARVRVLEPGSRWFGMTHREEKGAVTAELTALVGQGAYPERLW